MCAASRNGRHRPIHPGTTPSSATGGRFRRRIGASSLPSKRCRADAAATTAGPSTASPGMTRFSTVEIDFIADDPGPALLHCHNQDHQDEGFMGMMTYL